MAYWNRVQGAWLVFYRDVPEIQLISAPFAKVLFELAEGCPAGGFSIWRHWVLRVDEMRRANPESDVSVPPQLNEIAKRIDWIMPITPERMKSEGAYLFELLMQGDKDGRVRER